MLILSLSLSLYIYIHHIYVVSYFWGGGVVLGVGRQTEVSCRDIWAQTLPLLILQWVPQVRIKNQENVMFLPKKEMER